mgnify:CR=1 FL=1
MLFTLRLCMIVGEYPCGLAGNLMSLPLDTVDIIVDSLMDVKNEKSKEANYALAAREESKVVS